MKFSKKNENFQKKIEILKIFEKMKISEKNENFDFFEKSQNFKMLNIFWIFGFSIFFSSKKKFEKKILKEKINIFWWMFF